MSLLPIIEAYFNDISSGITPEKLAAYCSPAMVQTEFPNLFSPALSHYSLNDLLSGSQKGKGILSGQRIEIIRHFESGNTIIVEALWTGTLALPLGQIPIGGELRAHIARFFEFENGKIVQQRNYDCFEPYL